MPDIQVELLEEDLLDDIQVEQQVVQHTVKNCNISVDLQEEQLAVLHMV